jgi:tRNA nucleotidyltransferase/poly(A) polymerase
VDACCDGRKAKVLFTEDLAQDLARRDFTINAIAYDGETIYDYDGGIADLDDGYIRTVGEGYDRFREDYLRPIRGYRFSSYLRSVFDEPFTLALETDLCATHCGIAEKIGTTVSFERVIDEFNKVFKRAGIIGCQVFIEDMYKIGVLTALLPELDLGPKPCHELAQSPEYHPEGDVLTHIAIAVGVAEGIEGRWIALLHDIAKPITATVKETKDGKQHDYYSFHKHDKIGADMIKTEIKARLPLPNDLINKASLCARWHLYIYQTPPSGKAIRKVQAAMGEHLPLLRALGKADHMGRPLHPDVEKYFEEQEVPLTPIITGRMMLNHWGEQDERVKQGPLLGKVLKEMYAQQLEFGWTTKDVGPLMLIAYDLYKKEVEDENNSSS